MFGRVRQHRLHEVHPHHHADEPRLPHHREEGEPAHEHSVECIRYFGVRGGDGRVLGCVNQRRLGRHAYPVVFRRSTPAEVALGDHSDRGVVFVHDYQGWKLIEIHLVDGVPHRAFRHQHWNVRVQDFAEDHAG